MKENTTKLIKLCFYEQKQTYTIIIFRNTCIIQIYILTLQPKQYKYKHENKNRHPSRHNRARLHHFFFLSEVRPKDAKHHSELHQRQPYNKTFGRPLRETGMRHH